MPVPTPPTFVARSLTELVSIRARDQPDDIAVVTGAAEFGDELQTLTYGQVERCVDRLCSHYSFLRPASPSSAAPEQFIAVLTSTAIDESLLEIALAKLGLAGLLLSVNNSTAAVAHLVKQTRSTHLIYGTKFADTAAQAQHLLKREDYSLEIIAEKRFPIWGKEGIDEVKGEAVRPVFTPEEESKRTCVILHSSGSTGFPKPVYVTHYGLIANTAVSLPRSGFSALPLFHGFGHFSIFRCFYHGEPFTLFPPHMPLTSSNIVRIINASPCPPEQHFAVPYVLKLLEETEEGTKCLADFEAVSFAGAAVPDDLGDRLVKAGVNLISVYGTTETGSLLNSRRNYSDDPNWNWLRAEGAILPYLQMEPQGSNTFELVVLDGWPAKIMSNRADGSYATKDLFLQHPEHEHWYKYIGRLDDTLTQTLGEKTNPVPIELAIRGNSPLIQECIVFGDGRPQIGALILPSEQGAAVAEDPAQFLEAIWPVIEEANEKSPSHSRLMKEMIEILPVGTDIPVATKLSILRPACYKKFVEVIDNIYKRYEVGTGEPKRVIVEQTEMQEFLRDAILAAIGETTTGVDLHADTDLFSFGVDSLQATKVRNTVIKKLDLPGHERLGQNIVYEYPTIQKLARYLLGNATSGKSEANQAWLTMEEMVLSFAAEVEAARHPSSSKQSNGKQTILLTGATGSLGAHLLSQLATRSDVSRVICFARAGSDGEAMERIQQSLRQRMISASQAMLNKIEAYAADFETPNFGVQASLVQDMQSNVTSVVCNHWPVNFNMALDSFEPHIRGAVNLLNLAQRSTHNATFYFSSSISTMQGSTADAVEEDFPRHPSTAGGLGYGRSKWVVEKIMERVQEEKQAMVGVLRIGQLVGDSINGVWNETEAWPLMIKSGQQIKALPRLNERLSWLPVDLAASAIVEIVTNERRSAHQAVFHVVNPNDSATFADVVLPGLRQAGLSFEVVDRQQWLKALSDSAEDSARNPGRKLLPFYTNRIGGTAERPGKIFETKHTGEISETVAKCQPVTPSLVALWVEAWRKSSFLI